MSEQQPECPAEFAWIKEGVKVVLKDDAWHGRGISCVLTAKSEPHLPPNFDKWVVETDPDYGLLMWCEELLPAISSHGAALLVIADLNRTIGDQKEDAESIRGRLEEAEARASASDAILARVKALLDGVGPVVKTVAKAIDETDDHFNASPYDSHPDKFVLTCGYGEDAIGLAYEMDADDGNFVVDLLNGGVALLSAISEVREVLQ